MTRCNNTVYDQCHHNIHQASVQTALLTISINNTEHSPSLTNHQIMSWDMQLTQILLQCTRS